MKLWRHLGYAHMNEYLERELGYSPQVGIERLRVAHALADLPQIEASLDAGHLAFSAVRELTRVASAETEQDWLDKVRGKNLRQIEGMVSGKKRGDRPEDPSNPDLVLRVVRLELAPEVFALLRQCQSALADEHGGRLDDNALVEVMCRRALEGSVQADRPAYQIAITQCEGCGRAWQNGAGREVDVGREVVERAHCDAELIGPLDARDPKRVRTTVTSRVRRQVFARDHYRCTVPGCRSARNLDIHHIEYQSHGGGHEIQNLTTLCSAHHMSLHEGRLSIGGAAPDALDFTWREPIGPGAPDHHPPQGGDQKLGPEQPCVRPSPQPPSTPHVQPSPQAPSTSHVQPSSQAPSASHAQSSPQAPSTSHAQPSPRAPSAPHVQPSRQAPSARVQDRPAHARSARSDSADAARIAPSSVKPLAPHARHSSPAPDVSIEPEDATAAMIEEEACLALVIAGYRSREARAAVESARPYLGTAATLEQVIRAALHQFGSVAATFRSSGP